MHHAEQVYKTNPYACMVGDLSNKYGKMAITAGAGAEAGSSVMAQFSDRQLPSLNNMANRGLVLTCGSNMWCATLQGVCRVSG